MQAADLHEKQKADAKNAVEEYVYEMRDKLSDSLAEFVTEKVGSTYNHYEFLILFSTKHLVVNFWGGEEELRMYPRSAATTGLSQRS